MGHVPPKIPEKYFSGNYYVEFGHLSGKNDVKFVHFVNFSYIFFGQKCRASLKLTELLRLCCDLEMGFEWMDRQTELAWHIRAIAYMLSRIKMVTVDIHLQKLSQN